MTTNRLVNLVRSVRQVALSAPAPTDGTLLTAFLRDRDETAFEGLVRRYGPMVMGVCQRLLGRSQDADDAFQAAFLVLVRRAASILPRDLVGHWLYGVAYRTALRARSLKMRRHTREKQVETLPEKAEREREPCGDLQALIDVELSALPQAYRTVVVLCDLGGKTQREAARQLKLAEGTVSSRLSRGRSLLRRRLAQRGVTLAVGAAALSGPALTAGVPQTLMHATVKAAGLLAAKPAALAGIVSVPVAALVEGVTRAMIYSKVKVVMALAAFLTAALLGLTLLERPVAGGDKPGVVPGKITKTGDAGPKTKGPDEEPINHIWITNKGVQEELRLSEKQVKEIIKVRVDVAEKHKALLEESREAAKKRDYEKARELSMKVQKAEREAFAEAAPRIVSEAALKRLRQIQRQARGTHNLIREAAIHKKLKLDDEQLKQIEGFLKEGLEAATAAATKRAGDSGILLSMTIEDAIASERTAYSGAMKKVEGVLTDMQRRIWHDYLGEPFQFKAAK